MQPGKLPYTTDPAVYTAWGPGIIVEATNHPLESCPSSQKDPTQISELEGMPSGEMVNLAHTMVKKVLPERSISGVGSNGLPYDIPVLPLELTDERCRVTAELKGALASKAQKPGPHKIDAGRNISLSEMKIGSYNDRMVLSTSKITKVIVHGLNPHRETLAATAQPFRLEHR